MNNPEQESPPAVELAGVSKRFGERVILDRIDLEIARGEVLVLVGPSGSGKSTLLKIVSGIETPDEGRVKLAGVDCTEEPPYRRAVHTVFQNYALFPHLDVAGNVAFPLAVAGIPRSKREPLVMKALAWVRMDQHARRRIDALSGGEKQRVALARALVDQPQCVLLDEPLSALDPHLRSGTLDLLTRLQGELGLTYLFITHDREEALRTGHRIGVLNHGRLEQVASPEEIYQRPATAFVASFLGKINWLAGEVFHDGGRPFVQTCGCRVPLVSPVLSGAVQVGLRPEDVRIRTPTRSVSEGVSATVVNRLFFGDSTTLTVRTVGGSELTIDQRPASDAQPGVAVQIEWSPEAMHIFPAGEEVATGKEAAK
ncbi:MAG TPA: ABC transporter ATP-binding protein [Pirellulaceae bacterium]|nr:ABC transporter ATP-binding protein [Pirellulaceae bacterium]